MSNGIDVNITLRTNGVAQAGSTFTGTMRDMGAATKQTQAQLASFNAQAQATAKSVSEGYKGLGAALGMGNTGQYAKDWGAAEKAVLDAKRAMGMLGAESAKANAGIASLASTAANVRREIESLHAAGKSVTEGYKGLGAALGMNNQGQYARDFLAAEEAALNAKRALGYLGAEALKTGGAISASMDEATRKIQALHAAGKSVTEGYKGLGAAMGAQVKTMADVDKANAQAARANMTWFEKIKAGFADATARAGIFSKASENVAKETEKSSKRMVAANEKVGFSIRGWLPHMRTAAASIGIYFGVRAIANIIRVADSFTEMGARLRLVSGNTQELARAQEGLFKIAQATRAPLQDVVTTYFRLGNSMKDLGASQKDVLQTVETVGKAMRVSGASTVEISSAMIQLSQAFAKGKLDGDEFRAVMENAPRLMKALTDEFKISKGELYKWSETGRLSVEKLVQAIKNQSGAIEQEFKTIPVTISGAWQQVSNAFANYIGQLDNSNKGSKNLAETLGFIAENLDKILDPIVDVVGWIAKIEIGGWIAYNNILKDIAANLREIVTGKMDPEIAKLMKYGYGTVPIDQIVGGRGNAPGNAPVDPAVYGRQSLDTAKSYLGYSETNKKEELTDYLNKYSGTVFKDIAGEVNAWCARFVSAVLEQNGIQNPQTASARAFSDFGQSVWKQGDGNQGLENVKPGDIVVFTRGKGGHVAFVDSVNLQKGTFNALGGNQGNAVSIRERSFNDPNLMAIRRVVGGGDFFTGKNVTLEKLATTLSQLTGVQKMIVQKSIAGGVDPYVMLGLAQRESKFNPDAIADPRLVRGRGYEKTGMGMYQFLPGTGRQYGLMNDADRKNAEKATDAAIAHFKDLLASFQGDMTKALAAWNMGEAGVKRRLAQNQDPQQFTEGPHVQRILEFRKQWEARLKGKMPDLMGADDIKKQNKAFEEVLNQQFDAYGKHLKRLEDERAAYNTVDLAQQRTQMEKLEAQREQMRKADEAAMAVAQGSGNIDAVRQASATAAQHEIKFLKEKNDLLLKGMQIEYDAMAARKGDVGRKIADAQKNGGEAALASIPDLRSESKQLDASMKALAEQRKQLAIQTEAEIAGVTLQAEDDKRRAMQTTAEIGVEMSRNRIEGLQAEFAIQKELANISAEAFSQYADQQRGAIDLSLERAKAEFEGRDAQRQAMLEGKEGIDAIVQARENLNARLQDQLALLAQERDATVQKLDLTRQELEYQKRLAEWQLQRTQAIEPNDVMAQLQAKKQIADIEAQIAQNIQAQAKANEQLAREQAKAQGDAMRQGQRFDVQEVKENQLRMNAFWDQYMSRLRDYAALWQEITGQSETGWSRMAVAAGEYAKSVDQIAAYWDKSESQKEWGGLADTVEALQQGQAAAAMMAKTMMAARETVEKGSSAYDNLTTSAENFMQILQLLNVAEGIAAILKQLKDGDPYTAAIRAAGVAMMVASMGINTGFGGGASSGMSNSDARKASQSGGSTSAGGGVFGDSSAKSESISKALELVAQNSSADLAYSAGMLRSLRNIELSLAGTTNAIIRGVGPQQVKLGGTKPFGMDGASTMMRVIDPIGSMLGLTKITKKITDWGIKSLPQALDQVIAQGFQGMNWTEVTKTVKVFGMTVSKSVKNLYSALDTGVSGQITRVIIGMADAVREAGKAFGISAEQFNKGMANFTVNFGQMSTKGLKGDELEKAVQQVFSSMSDDMAQAFQSRFDLGLEPFMRAGQGMFETLVMVSNGINTATGILAQFGLEAINYQDIILKQGDVASEIVRQSIVMFEGVSSAIGAYVDQAAGSAEELMAVYQDLLIISDTAKIAGFNMNDLSNALIVTSGGVAKFLDNLTTYQTEILGGSDYARQMLTLTREFQKLGQAVPANNEAFIMLVDSIDTTTEAGQKLYAQILSLAGAFSKAQAEAQKLEELRSKYLPTDSLAAYKKQLAQVKTDFKDIIDGTLATLPGGPTYIRRTRRVEVLGNRLEDRSDKLNVINEDIAELEAKGKLTQKEKQRLATLRQQRKELNTEIAAIDKQIADINKLIEKNPKSKALLDERAKLLEEQGDAIIKTLADIWDQMTQAINAAKETLKSINDSIFELVGGTGSESIKLGMATARRTIAEQDYTRYTQNGGNDITQLNKYADAYYRAIMEERDAKIAAIEAPMKELEKERELRQKAHDEQISALEKQLEKSRELADAINAIRQYTLDLKTGPQSTFNPKQQLLEAQKQWDDIKKRALGGDVEALKLLPGGGQKYLDIAQKYFGGSKRYGAIFDDVYKTMEQLGATQVPDVEAIQQRIENLNKEHSVYLKGIEEKIAALNIEEQIKAENDKTAQRLKDLAKDLGPRITDAETKAREDMQRLIYEVAVGHSWSAKQLEALNAMLKNWGIAPIESPEKPGGNGNTGKPSNPESPVKPEKPSKPEKPVNPVNDPAKYDGPSAFKTWTDYWKAQQRIWKNHPEWEKTWSQFKVDEFQRLQSQGMHPVVPAFANGGFAQPGWALVGEEGPELVRFGAQAQVYDAERTARMLREMASFQPVPKKAGRPINMEVMPRVIDDIRPKNNEPAKFYSDDVVAELRAVQRELKALVTTQAGTNPELINELQTLNRRMDNIERQQRIKA